ncbi:hypothetical protein VUR80DRAFT_4336 [Thermomyces stellatus]
MAKAVNGANGTKEDDPPVLIVGAAGVSLGARLRHMGIPALLVDRHARVGNSWRNRYKSVMLNTPTFTDHYPFLEYPESWPRWLSRDAVADFMEHYAQIVGLDVQTNTDGTSIERDEQRGSRVRSRNPTAHAPFVRSMWFLPRESSTTSLSSPSSPARSSSRARSTTPASTHRPRWYPTFRTKKIVVIGPGTSGHDVAQDFDVTTIQRHPIFSLSAEAWETLQLGIWNKEGITTEEADLVGNSIPLAVARSMSIGLTLAMAEFDKEMMVEGLRKAGLAGASQIIIDGQIKIRRCEEGVKAFSEHGLTLADGTHLKADIVVMATGYKQNGLGDLGGKQERAGWWRPTGIPGLWYMTASFMWCRQFSQALALQIAVAVKGSR